MLYAGKYTEAVAAVNDAIDTNSPLPEANYGDVFDKFSTTKEILFARVFDQKDATNTSTRQQCYGNSPTKNKVTGGPPMSMWNWWGMILAPMPSSLK